MKGVILAAGRGTRMKPLTDIIPKCMLPVANIPILEWNIYLLRDNLGIKNILIVVSYLKEQIINYFGNGTKFGVKITYEVQDIEKSYGLGSALKLAQRFVGKDEFVLLLGDNLYKGPYVNILEYHKKLEADATIHIEEVDNPSRYGVVVMDQNDPLKILELIEKPENPPSNKVITGFYVLNNKIFKMIDLLTPSEKQGEIELTDALNLLVKKEDVYGILIDGWRKDMGYPEDFMDAVKWYLSNNQTTIQSVLGEDVKIITPVYIGKNCKISNSIIGPYVSIGENCELNNVYINNSILLSDTIIKDESIYNSIIGLGINYQLTYSEYDKEKIVEK